MLLFAVELMSITGEFCCEMLDADMEMGPHGQANLLFEKGFEQILHRFMTVLAPKSLTLESIPEDRLSGSISKVAGAIVETNGPPAQPTE